MRFFPSLGFPKLLILSGVFLFIIYTGLISLAAFGGMKYLAKKDREWTCLLYTSPSPRDLSTSRMPSSA